MSLLRLVRRFASHSQCNFLTSAVHSLPDPSKANKTGEDASYLSASCLAVADGLTWPDCAFDPAKYSRELMANVGHALVSLPAEKRLHPQAIMLRAAAQTSAEGGSTCCILTLDPQQAKVYSANLGDSGYYLLRMSSKGKVEIVGKSRDVVIHYNEPRLLGMQGDSADRCDVEVHEVQDKDLILMFTDGFCYNVFPEQVASFLKPFLALEQEPDLEVIAEMLAEKAFKQSQDLLFDSPFAVKAAENMLGLRWDGGKPNDITLIAAQVHLLRPNS